MVGSHAAGSATFNPLIDEAVGKLLGRHVVQVNGPQPPKQICFVGIDNRSAEELHDFRDQIYQQIDTRIVQSKAFRPISRRFVDAALGRTRMRLDELYDPQRMREFTAALEAEGKPFDYLMYAILTSGTTQANTSMQRDYLLTLELVDMQTGATDKEQAIIRKGYHQTDSAR